MTVDAQVLGLPTVRGLPVADSSVHLGGLAVPQMTAEQHAELQVPTYSLKPYSLAELWVPTCSLEPYRLEP